MKNKPKCPKCLTGGYTQSKSEIDNRPEFTCTQCDYKWTYGPAIIFKAGYKAWYLDGQKINVNNQKEFKRYLNTLAFR